MQTNWSLMLNILLLGIVGIAIVRMMRMKKESTPTHAPLETSPPHMIPSDKTLDDVIAVRKIQREPTLSPALQTKTHLMPNHKLEDRFQSPSIGVIAPPPGLMSASQDPVISKIESSATPPTHTEKHVPTTLVMFLLAKEHQQLGGYDLLQTILSAGFRFGEGQLFHRHQQPNGQGEMMCSLATATATGTFDLQNIGGFHVHGLCLFMKTTPDAAANLEKLICMIDAAKQLSEELQTHWLDDHRKPWSDEAQRRYTTLCSLNPKHQLQDTLLEACV